MNDYDYVYLDKLIVQEALVEYASPRSKLTRMLDAGEFLRIRRGLYLAGSETGYSLKTLANIIAGPSYVSFETALAFYGLIPERVVNVTSAIYGKNKHKRFETPVGSFMYRHIPEAVYYMDYRRLQEDDHPFLNLIHSVTILVAEVVVPTGVVRLLMLKIASAIAGLTVAVDRLNEVTKLFKKS